MRLSLCRRGLSQDGAVRARSRQHVRSKPVFGIMVGWPFVSLLPDSSLCMSVYLSARGTNPPQLQTYSPTEWRVGRSSVGGRRPPLIVVRLHVSYNTVYAESRRTAANCALPSADRTVCSMGMTLHIASLSTIAPVEYKPLLAARHGCHSKSKYSPY